MSAATLIDETRKKKGGNLQHPWRADQIKTRTWSQATHHTDQQRAVTEGWSIERVENILGENGEREMVFKGRIVILIHCQRDKE